MNIVIRYTVAPDDLDTNIAEAAAFCAAVKAAGDPEGRYTSYRLGDSCNFVHIGWFKDVAAKDRFQALPVFAPFAEGLKKRAGDTLDFNVASVAGSTWL